MHNLHFTRELGFFLVTALLAIATAAHNVGEAPLNRMRPINNQKANDRSLTLYSVASGCGLTPYPPTSFFNLSKMDSSTGLTVSTVYHTGDSCQPYQVVAPVADPHTKRAFVCSYHRTNRFELWGQPELIIFDMSDPNSAKPLQRIPLPASPDMLKHYFYYSLAYDTAANNLWVISQAFDFPAESSFLVKIDLNKGLAYNMTSLPRNTPFTSRYSDGVFNSKTRQLILPLWNVEVNGGSLIVEYDVDKANITSVSKSLFLVHAMVWDSSTGNTYGFLSSSHSRGLSYGLLVPGTGNWRILQQYQNYVVCGKMVLDSAAGVLYGGMRSDNELTRFVEVELKTGAIRRAVNLPAETRVDKGLFGM